MRWLLVVTLTVWTAGWAAAEAPTFRDSVGVGAVERKVPAVANPTCPDGAVFSQQMDVADPDWDALNSEETSYVASDNFWGVTDEICAVRWWGVFRACEESTELYTITFYNDAGGMPGEVVGSFSVEPVKTDTGLLDPPSGTNPIYQYDATLPVCIDLTSGWISISSYGDPTCTFFWVVSPDGDGRCYQTDTGSRPQDLAMCLVTAPDGDGDLVPDDFDDCPGTAAGDPVDEDGCSTADDDGDGVLNDQDDCPGTAAGDPVDADGCSTADDDGDGVNNDGDLCANTPTCATNVDANGCAIDSDGDGNMDGCEPPPQEEDGCCGATGPVAPLGLAVGMLLLARLGGYRRTRQRR